MRGGEAGEIGREVLGARGDEATDADGLGREGGEAGQEVGRRGVEAAFGDVGVLAGQVAGYTGTLDPDALTERCAPVPLAARLTQLKARTLGGWDAGAEPAPAKREREPDRYAALRAAADDLDRLPRKGRDVFGNGRTRRRPDGSVVRLQAAVDLLAIYEGLIAKRLEAAPNDDDRPIGDDEALALLDAALREAGGGGTPLSSIADAAPQPTAAIYAGLLRVALEGARDGTLTLRQDAPLAPIVVARVEADGA